MTKKTLRRMCILAGMAVLSVTAANAFIFDVKIVIDRALNSPTLTVRYTGANVALVELRVNGESLGTRSVSNAKASGETNFTLNLASLNDGDNTIEVCLYDKNAKLIGTEKSTISTDNGSNSPVFLSAPKVGATVQGPVEIKVGFGKELKNSYVSFFVDNQFKAMMNVPPFNYVWDSARESNGWHEVEAWVVDDSSQTMKTRKVKVFVNNPGGKTDRRVNAEPTTNPTTNPSLGNSSGIKPTHAVSTTVEKGTNATTPGTNGTLAMNPNGATIGTVSGTKPTNHGGATASGPKFLTPTGTRYVKNITTAQVGSTSNALIGGVGKIAITKGQRLPNVGSLVLLYNKQTVNFDVNPRVENGIPMTPIRHLLEKAGGEVKWKEFEKAVEAKAEGRDIYIAIGNKDAKIDGQTVELEVAPYIDRGRTIVPLSFIRETLNVDIEYDKATGHVLITPIKK